VQAYNCQGGEVRTKQKLYQNINIILGLTEENGHKAPKTAHFQGHFSHMQAWAVFTCGAFALDQIV
jgi:hypothetical protein